MDRYITERANARSDKLFRAKPNRMQLQLQTVYRVAEDSGRYTFELGPRKQINRVGELEHACVVEKSNECFRIYTIQHIRTWSTLDISRELLDGLFGVHQIFPELWRVLLTFGLKSCENEYGFPVAQVKESRTDSGDVQELAYVMRRVEQNGKSSPDCPWSIRHTGVYQKLVHPEDRSQEPRPTLLLVAPSSAIENSVLEAATARTNSLKKAFLVQRSIVASSLTGWMDYMCWLEDQLKLKTSRVMITLGSTGSRALSFVEGDRQDLRQLEEYITDLRVLLHTKVQTIRRLKTSYQRLCSLHCAEPGHCECHETIQELEQYADEAWMYLERAGVLQDRVQSVQKLLSDLLGYEELRTLRELMVWPPLPPQSVSDPAKNAQNFFSTEFVKIDGENVQVSRRAWLMVAVAAPMTICVLGLWRLWLRYVTLGLRPFSLAPQSLKALVKTRRREKEDTRDEV
ncbi:hypothetical protein BDW75DRAFT_227612 [Aspergillus navahoensis]